MPTFFGSFHQPPSSGSYFSPGCVAECTSFVSQEAADECAARQAAECAFDGTPGDGNPVPGGRGGTSTPRFGNSLQSCDAECPGGGGTVTALVAPGTVVTATQADADARAHSLACQIAQDMRVCFSTLSPLPSACLNDFMSVVFDAYGGTEPYTFALASGSLPPGTELNAQGNLFGTPLAIGTYTFDVTVTDAIGTAVTKAFSLVVADCTAATAPCSLFVADNTSFGIKNVPIADLGSVTWTGLTYGSYSFVYQGNAIPIASNVLCGATPTDSFFIPAAGPPSYLSTDGASGTFPNQSHHSFTCGAGSATGFDNQADAIADYLTHTPVSFTHLENAPVLADVTVTNHFAYIGGTGPSFELVRTQKLIADQPLAVELESLATYAAGRFALDYSAASSAPLAFTDSAVLVQAALNALVPIIADGGVVCAGTLAAGMTITWNVNGARSLIAAAISTVSPGVVATIVRTQGGTGGQPEIQRLTVAKFCADFPDSADADYSGSIPNRRLFPPLWYLELALPGVSTIGLNRFPFVDSYITLECCPDAPTIAPTGADLGPGTGDIAAGTYYYCVAFVNSGIEFTGSESPLGPVSDPVVVAAGTSSINVTNIPLGPSGTTARFLYRTRAGDPTRFYGAVSVPGNVATTATDTAADADIFSAPIPAAHFWRLWLYAIANTPGPNADLMWSGFKTSGNTPLGAYTAYRHATATNCGTPEFVDGGIASMTVAAS